MEYKDLWMALDTARDMAVDGAQQLSRAAAGAMDAVRGNFGAAHDGAYQEYCASAEYLRGRLGDFSPEVLLILGSGLGFLGDEVENLCGLRGHSLFQAFHRPRPQGTLCVRHAQREKGGHYAGTHAHL